MSERNIDLAPLTSLQIGGPADFLSRVRNTAQLEASWTLAKEQRLPTFFLGAGTNVLFADEGFRGMVIRNEIVGRARAGREILVGGGENLPDLISWLNIQGLAGMQRMYGIPGTVAGAIVGNAGAYGQEISKVLQRVTVWSRGRKGQLDAPDLGFAYRHSRFKEERDKFIVSCVLRLRESRDDLQLESQEILEKREEKYPPGLRCPGSFFKNVILEELPREIRMEIPQEFVSYGKVPAGKLLEAVGANSSRLGGAEIASYHGNLLVNSGGALASEVLGLAQKYADLVYESFGISLKPEIRLAADLQFDSPQEKNAGEPRRSSKI